MSNCLHNEGLTRETVKTGKDKITYLKCKKCGAVLPN